MIILICNAFRGDVHFHYLVELGLDGWTIVEGAGHKEGGQRSGHWARKILSLTRACKKFDILLIPTLKNGIT